MMPKSLLGAAVLGGLFLGFSSSALATQAQVVSTPQARKSLALTVYQVGNQTTGFVREVREVDLPAGETRLELQGVPETLERASVGIHVVEGPAVTVLEQTYSFDTLTPEQLLRAAEGSWVAIDHPNAHTGELQAIGAWLVAPDVYRTLQGYTFGIESEHVRFMQMPRTMTPKPTLFWKVQSPAAGRRKIELSYLVSGLRWNADYNATLSPDGKTLEWEGWVTVDNGTSVDFENADLGVVAGSVHRVMPSRRWAEEAGEGKMGSPRYTPAPEPERESLGEAYLYKIPQPTSLDARSTKNVHLLKLSGIPVQRRWKSSFYIYPSSHSTSNRPTVYQELEWQNSEKSHAGVPLPGGMVRVYVPDRQGQAQLVGSSSINNTATDEKVVTSVGAVSDVQVQLIPTDYQTSLLGARQATYTLEIRNGGGQSGTIRLDLRGDRLVDLQVQGATVSEPSAKVWRIETALGPHAQRKYQVIVRAESARSSLSR